MLMVLMGVMPGLIASVSNYVYAQTKQVNPGTQYRKN